MTVGRGRTLLLLALLVALASLPLWAPRFWIYIGTQALIFAIFAMSLDLLLGYAGLASFGHAAFYGVGAYACGLLALRHVDALIPLLLIGALASAAVAVPIGALSLRATGIYFLMLTLAFAQILWGLAVNWTSLTRGTDGLIGVPRPALPGAGALGFTLNERGPFFILCLAVAVLVFLLLEALTRSPFGRTLEGIRENERRMRALGFPTFRYRLAVFVVGGAIAGLAGSLAAMSNGFATPDLLYWTVSGLVLVAVVVGGSRSLVGPVLGAFLVLIAQLGLSTFVDRWELVLGALFIAFVLFLPRGLVGLVRRA
ncbi:MAG: branched-chain amino acid ABC transporter permease [Candidatus Dormibacteraeota bacterium]|uniref:Branched-chain amino acid ABC transporter permease n=1 Tax=Candidatus Dormiibacter inghamiae TaxID=3127013 RepID=A0A934KJ89_9BACT|nr:branched-chain amino acid ABC transporter permease [Candidatus Dormibacteraeota bacterium]